MRMFLICMTDIFLILYLTALANGPSQAVLTVDDFFQLKGMHDSLQKEKQETEAEFQARLLREQQEKENLNAKLNQEKDRLEEMEQNLLLSDAQRERINEELAIKEQMLKSREELLKELNKKIESKESLWQQMEQSFKQELQKQKQTVEEHQKMADQLQKEARSAQILADQMKQEAEIAYQTADNAQNVQQKALNLKEEALKQKEEAERKARAALAAREKAEAEKEKALKAMQEAKNRKEEAEETVKELAGTIKVIKRDAETAYSETIRPRLQTLHVTYERQASSQMLNYERDLNLLPVKIENKTYLIFPSRQIGFTRRSDKAPENLVITYHGTTITNGWINTQEDLIAIPLPDEPKNTFTAYPDDTDVSQLMPTLLALRNQGNRNLFDKIRGISDEYFIVKRDYLKENKTNNLEYTVTGFRGTGTHAERITPGDQLVDLNGRLIGVANDENVVIRVGTIKNWKSLKF